MNALFLPLLLLPAFGAVPDPQTTLMDEIEARVVLPANAYPLARYVRAYAYDGADRVRAIYLVENAPGTVVRHWYRDPNAMPQIDDGGCMQVNIEFDIRARRILYATCNGIG